jgi:hypothetical protein
MAVIALILQQLVGVFNVAWHTPVQLFAVFVTVTVYVPPVRPVTVAVMAALLHWYV